MELHIAASRRSPGSSVRAKYLLRHGLTKLLWWLRLSAFGRPPDIRSWHPRWPDFEVARQALRKALGAESKLLVVCDTPASFTHWLADLTEERVGIESERLLALSNARYSALTGQFTAAL